MAAYFNLVPTSTTAQSLETDLGLRCLDNTPETQVAVAKVTDGDTVVLTDGRRVSLIGVNTLELSSPSPKDKQWAEAAKEELEELIRSNSVTLVAGYEQFDRHGRTLAHLKFQDGRSVAEVLINQGLGLAITVGQNQRCALEFEESEQRARQAKLGIWKKPGNWFNSKKTMTGRERGFQDR